MPQGNFMNSIPSDLITVAQAARLVNNTHHAAIRRWILKGKLRAYTLAGGVVVSRADVLAIMQRPIPRQRPRVQHG
jgi:hypothetical protein